MPQFVDMPSAIAAVRAAFVAQARGEAVNIPRTRLDFGERRLNLMAGVGLEDLAIASLLYDRAARKCPLRAAVKATGAGCREA
jgi:ornithine cyclodeaminase/alanine dehydrogenase-like protein (mu-crystallin family)